MTGMQRSGDAPASSADLADEFVAALRRLRAGSGRPSFRRLSEIAEKRIANSAPESRPEPLPPSTISEVLAGKRLPRMPRWGFVESYVAACLHAAGADDASVAAEIARWRARWSALAAAETPESAETPEIDGARSPGRRAIAAAMAAVFLLGTGTGVAGTLWWTQRPSPDSSAAATPDDCVTAPAPAGTVSAPAGKDVLQPPARADWWINDPALGTVDADGGRFDTTVAGGTQRPADVLIVRSDITLVQGHVYTLAFTAEADRGATIRVRVQDSEPPAYHPSFSRDLTVGPATCRHAYRFTGAKTSPHSELTFQVGGQPERFRLRVSDVVMAEGSS
ncbi:carbohydrate binding domain-containing protein [Actinoplanes sp. NPDC023936]|uniref:carbohydrate binding domain-containing protein n=1 Tax=Actinoplanes sp. NPDC023936 TaxID=3154910 RepID=UPI0033F82AD1